MKRHEKNNKSNSKGCLGCLGIVAVIFILSFGITLFNSYSHRDDKKIQTVEEQLKEVSKNSTLKTEGKNAIVTIKDEIIPSGNIFINVGFPELASKDLKILKNEDYDNIIIRVNADFLDEKGNSSEDVLISSMFEKTIIKDINFDNWVDQVIADSTVFYELSSAYYIQSKYFMDNEDSNTIPKTAAKTLPNTFWNTNGY